MHRTGARYRRRAPAAALVIVVVAAWVPARAMAAATVEWDGRIRPIAAAVERLRGLKFEHTVPVEFLSEARFRKRVAADHAQLSKSEREDVERSGHQLRAVGLIASGTNVLDALTSLESSGVLAYYDNEKKRVTVRGTHLDVSTRVVLAHELTHVLQDQHFDLTKLERKADHTHSSSVLRTLVEGDAVRIQNAYIDELGDSDRVAYEKAQTKSSSAAFDEIRGNGIPDALSVVLQEPYVFGPPMLDLLIAERDKSAVDGLFRDPPTVDSSYLTPRTLVEGTSFKKVATPKLSAGEKRSGHPDVFGAFALFLVLASRGDPADALAAADGWGGDSMITFTRNSTTCVRTTFVGRDADATDKIDNGLKMWAAGMPTGAVSIATGPGEVTTTACDAAATGEPPNSAIASLVLGATRDQLLAEIVHEGGSIAAAECTANGLVRDAAFQPLLAAAAKNPNAEPDASLLGPIGRRVIQLTAECAAST